MDDRQRAVDDDKQQRRVLIAGNERYLMRVLRRGLEAAGYAVAEVCSGESALHAVRACAPDVLIVDSDLVPMNGEELCRRLQNQLPQRSFLTCILTSSAEDEYSGFAEWFSHFHMLEKPVSMHRLLGYIERFGPDRAA
jgi:CheY-like chemotaxis protein